MFKPYRYMDSEYPNLLKLLIVIFTSFFTIIIAVILCHFYYHNKLSSQQIHHKKTIKAISLENDTLNKKLIEKEIQITTLKNKPVITKSPSTVDFFKQLEK